MPGFFACRTGLPSGFWSSACRTGLPSGSWSSACRTGQAFKKAARLLPDGF